MGVSGIQEVTITASDGKKTISTATDVVTADTTYTIVCDSSKCESRHGKKYSYTWSDDESRKNPEILPDQFFHLIKVTIDPVTPKELVFCCSQCVRDWLTYEFVPAKSPRELAAEQVVQKTDGLPTAEDLDAVARDAHYAAITSSPDATGYSEAE